MHENGDTSTTTRSSKFQLPPPASPS